MWQPKHPKLSPSVHFQAFEEPPSPGGFGQWPLSLGQEDFLDEGTATHSSILSRRIPWTEDPGGLPPMESYATKPLSTAQHSPLWLGSQQKPPAP